MVTEQNQLTLLRENLLLQAGHTLIIAASRFGQNELGGRQPHYTRPIQAARFLSLGVAQVGRRGLLA
jgi:hypothetical protein